MAAKVIGLYLTLSYFFLCVLGNMQITVEQFNNFKGSDPTKNCGNDEKMQQFCNDMMKLTKDPLAKGEFQTGYPKCYKTIAQAQQNSGGGTTEVNPYIITCAWAEEVKKTNKYHVFGKGMTPNHLMYYVVAKDGTICYFDTEYPYSN